MLLELHEVLSFERHGKNREKKWSGAGSNRRHMDFQSIALPTELPDLIDINRWRLHGKPRHSKASRTTDLIGEREILVYPACRCQSSLFFFAEIVLTIVSLNPIMHLRESITVRL